MDKAQAKAVEKGIAEMHGKLKTQRYASSCNFLTK